MAKITGYKGLVFSGDHPADIKVDSLNEIFEDLGKKDVDGYTIVRAQVYNKGNGGIVIHLINEKDRISDEYYLRALYFTPKKSL